MNHVNFDTESFFSTEGPFVSTKFALGLLRNSLTRRMVEMPVAIDTKSHAVGTVAVSLQTYAMFGASKLGVPTTFVNYLVAQQRLASYAPYAPTYEALLAQFVHELSETYSNYRDTNRLIASYGADRVAADLTAILKGHSLTVGNQGAVRSAQDLATLVNNGFEHQCMSVGMSVDRQTALTYTPGKFKLDAYNIMKSSNYYNITDTVLAELILAYFEYKCVNTTQIQKHLAFNKTNLWADAMNCSTPFSSGKLELDGFNVKWLGYIAKSLTRIVQNFMTATDIPAALTGMAAKLSQTLSSSIGHNSIEDEVSSVLTMLAARIEAVRRETILCPNITVPMHDLMQRIPDTLEEYTPAFNFTPADTMVPYINVSYNDMILGSISTNGEGKSERNIASHPINVSKIQIIGALQAIVNTLRNEIGVAIPQHLQLALNERLKLFNNGSNPRIIIANTFQQSLTQYITDQQDWMKDLFIECLYESAYYTPPNVFSSAVINKLDVSQKKEMNWIPLNRMLERYDIVMYAFKLLISKLWGLLESDVVKDDSLLVWEEMLIKDWTALLKEHILDMRAKPSPEGSFTDLKYWFDDTLFKASEEVNMRVKEYMESASVIAHRCNTAISIYERDVDMRAANYYTTFKSEADMTGMIQAAEYQVSERCLYPAYFNFDTKLAYLCGTPVPSISINADRIYSYQRMLDVFLTQTNLDSRSINLFMNSIGRVANLAEVRELVQMPRSMFDIYMTEYKKAQENPNLSMAQKVALSKLDQLNQFFVMDASVIYFDYGVEGQLKTRVSSGQRADLKELYEIGTLTQKIVLYPLTLSVKQSTPFIKVQQTRYLSLPKSTATSTPSGSGGTFKIIKDGDTASREVGATDETTATNSATGATTGDEAKTAFTTEADTSKTKVTDDKKDAKANPSDYQFPGYTDVEIKDLIAKHGKKPSDSQAPKTGGRF